MRRTALALLVSFAALAAGACRSDNPVVESGGPVTTESVRVISVEVLAGQVIGGNQQLKLAVGEKARLNIRSDVADEVLLTVLDQRLQVPAGGVATLDVVTDRAGRFEARLVQQNLLLATVIVGPEN